MGVSQKTCWIKGNKPDLQKQNNIYDIQEQAKLIYGDRRKHTSGKDENGELNEKDTREVSGVMDIEHTPSLGGTEQLSTYTLLGIYNCLEPSHRTIKIYAFYWYK